MKPFTPHERVVVDVGVIDIQRATAKWRARSQQRQQQPPIKNPVDFKGESCSPNPHPAASTSGELTFLI